MKHPEYNPRGAYKAIRNSMSERLRRLRTRLELMINHMVHDQPIMLPAMLGSSHLWRLGFRRQPRQ